MEQPGREGNPRRLKNARLALGAKYERTWKLFANS
jgi:hypothetical protein